MNLNQRTANDAVKNIENPYGFNLSSAVAEVPAPYDNEGACQELSKDMMRGDNLSIRFSKDTDGYACVWVESKNVAPYKVRLNPAIFAWIMQYLVDVYQGS